MDGVATVAVPAAFLMSVIDSIVEMNDSIQ